MVEEELLKDSSLLSSAALPVFGGKKRWRWGNEMDDGLAEQHGMFAMRFPEGEGEGEMGELPRLLVAINAPRSSHTPPPSLSRSGSHCGDDEDGRGFVSFFGN